MFHRWSGSFSPLPSDHFPSLCDGLDLVRPLSPQTNQASFDTLQPIATVLLLLRHEEQCFESVSILLMSLCMLAFDMPPPTFLLMSCSLSTFFIVIEKILQSAWTVVIFHILCCLVLLGSAHLAFVFLILKTYIHNGPFLVTLLQTLRSKASGWDWLSCACLVSENELLFLWRSNCKAK